LEESEIFMIIMTPASISSENVRDEIGYAIDNGKRFLPVLLENCTVPLRLRRFQYVDFTNKSFDEGVEAARDLLRGLIAQPTIPRMEAPVAAQAQAEAEGKAREEAERKAKEESDRLARQIEDEELAAKAEANRPAVQKAEAERLAKEKAAVAEIKAEPGTFAPAEKKPAPKAMMYGIAAVALLAIVGIAYGALSRGRNTNTPATTPTTDASIVVLATEAQPIPTQLLGPIILDASDATKILDNNEAKDIHEISKEQYTEDEFNSFRNNSQPIPVTLTNPGPITFRQGWCAVTQDILEENLAYIKITIKFDNKVVPGSKLVERYQTVEGGECFFKYIVIDNWITGEYTTHRGLTITQAINDGQYDYEPTTPANYQWDYIVTVQ
jgi:hypothetical protein